MKKLFFLILLFSQYSFATDPSAASCTGGLNYGNSSKTYVDSKAAACPSYFFYSPNCTATNCGGTCPGTCTCPAGKNQAPNTASKTIVCCPVDEPWDQFTLSCRAISESSSSSSVVNTATSSSSGSCPQGQIQQGTINGQPICQGTCPTGLFWGSVNGVEGCYGTNNCPNGGAYGTVNGVSGCYGTQSNSSSGTANSSVANASTGSNSSVSNTSSGSNNSTGSNTSSGSNNSSGSNASQGSNSSAGAGECDPTSNDYLDCLMPNINSEIPSGDFSQSQQQAASELAATKAELQAKYNQIKNQFSQSFGATLTPASRQLDDGCVDVKGQQACFGLGKWQSHLGIIGLVVMFVAAFLSLKIVLSR